MQKHVNKNLEGLIRNTKCTTAMIELLLLKNLITEEEAQILVKSCYLKFQYKMNLCSL